MTVYFDSMMLKLFNVLCRVYFETFLNRLHLLPLLRGISAIVTALNSWVPGSIPDGSKSFRTTLLLIKRLYSKPRFK